MEDLDLLAVWCSTNVAGLNGLELQQQLAERTDMPIVFITGHGTVPMSVQAMKAGAVEFLTKPFKKDVLLDAIRGALERSRLALRLDSEMRVLRMRYESLTPRERQVMALVVSGLLNKQVGGELGISEITVKKHRGRMLERSGSGDRCTPQLIASPRVLAHIGSYGVNRDRILCQNCVTCPPKPRSNTVVYGDTSTHIDVVKSLIGSVLVRLGVRQHARPESISKRARSTTPTSLRFRINELRAVRNSVAQNPPSNLHAPRSLGESAVCE